MIQKPTVNPGVMIIVTGKKGCGKDTLLNFLSTYVVGDNLSKSYNSTDQFFDHYDVKQNKILLKLEEANRYACLKNQDVLKSFVTSEQLTVNEKHKASFTCPNYSHIFFTTNKENPVAFTEQERRFLLVACSDEKFQDKPYWIDLYETFFCPEAGKAVGEYLMARPLEGFNPRIYPVSDYQEAIIEAERSVEERFVEQWDGHKVNSAVFYQQYRDWCAEQSCQSITSSIVFGRAMGKPHRDGLLDRTKTGGLTYYWKP
jgi:phage/plasmid-associated DNA primase